MGKDNFGERVTSILEAHYHDEAFGVVQLAEKLFLSRSQLHRKLGAMTGKSASRYIREFRLNKSLEFLTERESTVSEVA